MKPIYTTSGDWVALVDGIYIYDTRGEWIAWLDGADVYTCEGYYIGKLSDDHRIVRRRLLETRERRQCPRTAPRIRPPASVPLPPLFAELPWHMVDCFEEDPEMFKRISDLRPDWED